ncbi:MAG: peptide-methionine (S)-S-oxide reductase MsrA [Gemmatimonadota bacterium]|nr:peptide-methionine (S)-S-oxide reductase MsrA [Gemmatimonadota bacterium]
MRLSITLATLLVFVASAGDPPAAQARTGSEALPDSLHVATFAGGCFWCVEEAFDEVEGVERTISGYTGGHVEDPSYEQVSAGGTGHREAVLVVYDPAVVSYEELLDVFWHNVDPTDAGGQFCDRGESYATGIWYRTENQKRLAETTKAEIERTKGWNVVTPIEPAETFYEAEGYHQNYHRKNPVRYKFYKWNCGRQQRLDELWGES